MMLMNRIKYCQAYSLFITLLVFTTTYTVAAEKVSKSDWPFYRGDSSLRGQASGKLILPLNKKWEFNTDGPVKSSPIVIGNHTYFASNDGFMRCVSIKTGELTWKTDLRYATDEAEKNQDQATVASRLKAEGAALYHKGIIYIGAANGFLHALNAANGKRIWAYETFGEIACSPIAAQIDGKDHFLIGSHDNFLHCVTADGKKRWEYETDNYVNATPALAQFDGKQVALFGGCDGIIHCVDIQTGKALRAINIGTYMSGSATARNGVFYVGHHGNEVMAFDLKLKTDTPKWKYKEKNFPFFGSPALKNEFLLIGSRDKKLHCINPDSGEGIWQARTRGRIDSSPVIVNDKVVVGSDDGRLYVFNLKDGKRLYDFDTGGKIASSPAVAHGLVLIGNDAGKVFCLTAN